MQQPFSWCHTLDYQGTTILLTRGYDYQRECYLLSTTFMPDHLLPYECSFAQATLSTTREDGNEAPFTQEEWQAYCERDAVIERVSKTVTSMLKTDKALH